MPGQLIDGIDPTAVTGGNAHDHVGGDGAAVPYATGLSGQPALGTAAAQDVGAFAAAANGVTNGDSHDHAGGDGGQIAYSGLSGLPTLGTAAAEAATAFAPAAAGVTGGNSHAHGEAGDGGQILYSDLASLPTLGSAAAEDTSAFAAAAHAASHTSGADDIQSATAAQKGLMTAAYAAKLDAVGALTADTTVNLTYDLTAAQIQALIDAQPRNLGGYTLTFQFGDGTYNTSQTARLTFSRFYAGTLVVQGNTGDTTPYLPGTNDPAVFLDASAGATDGLYFLNVACPITLQNIKILTSDTAYAMGVQFSGCSGRISVYYLVAEAAGKTTTTIGCGVYSCTALSMFGSFFCNQALAISANCSRVFSSGNNDYGTAPNYGLQAGGAGTIGKDGDQPNGATNDELAESGGEIR